MQWSHLYTRRLEPTPSPTRTTTMGTEKSEREKKKNDIKRRDYYPKKHLRLVREKTFTFFPIQVFWIFPHVLKNVLQTFALLTNSKKKPSSMYSLRQKNESAMYKCVSIYRIPCTAFLRSCEKRNARWRNGTEESAPYCKYFIGQFCYREKDEAAEEKGIDNVGT